MINKNILEKLYHMRDLDYEIISILGFYNNNFIFSKVISYLNNKDNSFAKVEDISDLCKKNKCNKVLLAHNHPFEIDNITAIESVYPSKDDLQTTDYIKTFLQCRGIKLIDHIIISKTMELSIFNFIKTGKFPDDKNYVIVNNCFYCVK